MQKHREYSNHNSDDEEKYGSVSFPESRGWWDLCKVNLPE